MVLGFVNWRVGRIEEAVELWEQVRSQNPDLLHARIGLAGYYESEGRHDDAREVVDEIMRVNPRLTGAEASSMIQGTISAEVLRRAGLK